MQRDYLRQLHTSESPTSSVLTSRRAWIGVHRRRCGGGVIDTGIWPEHPSFAARPGLGRSGHHPGADPRHEPRYPSRCPAADVISATPTTTLPTSLHLYTTDRSPRYAGPLPAAHRLGTYTTARDYDGHGSHTASTAAGTRYQASIFGHSLGISVASPPMPRSSPTAPAATSVVSSGPRRPGVLLPIE